jgi:hypothetical protein
MALKTIEGLPILDAKKAVTLIINDNDINKADPKEPKDCAVARACRRGLHVKEVRVHLGRVYLRQNEGNWLRYMTPRYLRSEIIAFDRGGKFAPGEYTLQAPGPSRRTKKAQGSKKSKTAHSNRKTKRRSPHVVTDVRTGPA